MAATLLLDTLKVKCASGEAEATFAIDGISDIPERGAAVTWVQVDETDDIGAAWYVYDVLYEEVISGAIRKIKVIAKQPGGLSDWTWVDGSGDPLQPLEEAGKYSPIVVTKVVASEVQNGYWNLFSNWSDTDNFTADEYDPLYGQFMSWNIQFVSSTNYMSPSGTPWLGRKNGTWPTGITPPKSGAGIYLCHTLDVDFVLYRSIVTGTATTYYRHTGEFWQAPEAPTPGQLTWNFSAW